MVILTFPDLIPTRAAWGLKSNTESFVSPLSGTTQTVARLGARWKATLEFSGLTLDDGAALDAFLARLGGRSGRFELFPHHRPGNVGTGFTTINVPAGSIGLAANGYAPSTQIFKGGDFIKVGGELKMVALPVTTNASGVASIQFSPPMRSAVSIGSPITGTKPTALMMLDADEYSVGRGPERAYDSIVISCTEAFA